MHDQQNIKKSLFSVFSLSGTSHSNTASCTNTAFRPFSNEPKQKTGSDMTVLYILIFVRLDAKTISENLARI